MPVTISNLNDKYEAVEVDIRGDIHCTEMKYEAVTITLLFKELRPNIKKEATENRI